MPDEDKNTLCENELLTKARFIRCISAVSNAFKTIDNEMICFIIFCLNCIRHGRNATYEPGLRSLRNTHTRKHSQNPSGDSSQASNKQLIVKTKRKPNGLAWS